MARDSRRVAKRANRPNPREERNQTTEPAAFLARSPFGRDGTPENVVPFTRAKKVELLPRNMAQERYIEALSDETKPMVFAMGPAGTGKAQPLDARIRTPTGWATMGDMRPGSKILAADGSTQSVVAIYPQGAKPTFRITFEDGRSTRCCEDHLWEVHHWEWSSPRVVDTKEIIRLLGVPSKSKRLYVRLFTPSNESEPADLPVDPYVVGCLLGDGTIHRNLGITSADSELVEEVASRLPDGMLLRKTAHINGIGYSIIEAKSRPQQGTKGVLRNRLRASLKALDLWGCDSATKFIPDSYLLGNTHQRLELLRGLMDTDGTVDRSGSLSFCTISPRLAHDFGELVRSLGGLCKTTIKKSSYTYKGTRKRGQDAFQCSVRLRDPQEAFLLARKRDKAPSAYQYASTLKLRICGVQPDSTVETQCILVSSPDHLYVTDDYIVTHNTMLATKYAIQQMQDGECDRIVITRPAVSVDEQHGFLPGTLIQKCEPWMLPILDVFREHYDPRVIQKMMLENVLEIAPLAYCRGRTFKNCIVIGDEMQNATPSQMKMLLTRIGDNSRMFITGDLRQHDRGYEKNGLKDFVERLSQRRSGSIAVVEFGPSDVERHPVIEEILAIYGED